MSTCIPYKRATPEEKQQIQQRQLEEATEFAEKMSKMTDEEYSEYVDSRFQFIAEDDEDYERLKIYIPNTWKKYFGWIEGDETSNYIVVDDELWFGEEKDRKLDQIKNIVIPNYNDALKLLPTCKSLMEALVKTSEARVTGDPNIPLFLFGREVENPLKRKFTEQGDDGLESSKSSSSAAEEISGQTAAEGIPPGEAWI